MTLEEAVEYAARHLPEGWEVSVRVEKDAGFVQLEDPLGERIETDSADTSLADEVAAAVRLAREMAGECQTS